MARPTRIKTTAIEAPATQRDAEELLQRIGELQRDVSRIEHSMNDRLSAIKAEYELKAKPINDEIEGLFQALHVWAEANKHDLLKGRAKTAKLATGELSWRTTPPSVRITGQDVVMERLKQLGLQDLIRTKEEISKEAVLADPQRVEGIKGIAIVQREEFVAKPFESQIERAEPVKKAAA